ncbi:MAG: nicotinamide mononucleotide transporter [Clostridia bacterium]|nr:nicotinamide mononucleotide transporter [Clostridia bacterium]
MTKLKADPLYLLILLTAAAITVTGILWNQHIFRMIPLYISLVVGLLQANANRYANLIGGINSLLYVVVYLHFGLYASAANALLVSFPFQIATFIRWSRHAYRNSTEFRRMSWKNRILIALAFIGCYIVVYVILTEMDSSYRVLDNLISLLAILSSILTLFSFIEYTWLMLPICLGNMILNLIMMIEYPEQITYLIYSVYSFICIIRQFFAVRNIYAEQLLGREENQA